MNGSTEEKVRTSCDALPAGWTKEIVARRSGLSAGKSDVYYYSPTGKKIRSKPELAQWLQRTSGEVIDLANFDFRSGKFVEGRSSTSKSTNKRKYTSNEDAYSKDLFGITMVCPTFPARQSKKVSKEPVTVISSDNSSVSCKNMLCNGTRGQNGLKDEGIVSPRQIFWEKRLQSMNCTKNGLDEIDIFSSTNGEFCSLLHSIVKTLQVERDMATKRAPLANGACSPSNLERSSKPMIRITKEDILRQEKQVVKARKELAKAITEYEAVKSL